jgi:hypothetical protein
MRLGALPAFALLAVVSVPSCSQDGTVASSSAGCPLSGTCAASPAEYDVPPPPSCASSDPPPGEPASPVDFGKSDLSSALAQTGSAASVDVVTVDDARAAPALAAAGATLDPRPESFAIVPAAGGALVVGGDAVGAMYGAFELAEQLRLGGGTMPALPVARAPTTGIRGYNPHIEMPENGEDCWYFLDASFWAGYLGELAHARIDWLDLYAVQSLQSSRQVNVLRYLATSPSFPQVGIPAGKRAANVAMLQTIVQMAAVRGIRVSLLSGRSDLDACGDDGAASLCPLASQADLETYTREAVQDLATQVPGLWRIGVRIGESYEDAGFYARTYLAALDAVGGAVGFYTRTWLSNLADVTTLATSPGGQGSLVEAKFSMEQYGPPYVPQNGSWAQGPADWKPSYLYEDYLDGDEPFTFVFHVWNSATYRFFRFASPDRTRRALASMQQLSPRVAGFTVQAAHALESQHDWWHARPEDRYSPWTYARDELEPTLYGRIGYDPTTSDTALRAVLAGRVGTDAFWDAERAGSDVVAWIVTAHACGPDSRDFMAQLEWVGPVGYWAARPNADPGSFTHVTCVDQYHGPLDTFGVASPYEAAQDLVAGRATARISPVDVALQADADVATLRAAAQVPYDASSAWARDVSRECGVLADLGDYFAHKLRGATALAVFQATGASAWMSAARTETEAADAAWRALATDTSAYFVSFTDPYRTAPPQLGGGVPDWSAQAAFLPDDPASLDAVASAVTANPPAFAGTLPDPVTWLHAARPSHPDAALSVQPQDPRAASWTVTVTVPGAPDGTTVTVWAKAFTSTSDWLPSPASGSGSTFTATIPGTGGGALFAAEIVESPTVAWRAPDPRTAMPYVALSP